MRIQSTLSRVLVVAAGLSTQIPWALAQQPRPVGAAQVGSDAVLIWNAAAGAAAMRACISPIDNPFHESRIYQEGTAYGRKIGERAIDLSLRPVK